ncbi:MAG: Uma2 family endonuclease [Planctomycetes bacterium]|nr:Uma2 family endonuclease [Planctomycetota bacterium]
MTGHGPPQLLSAEEFAERKLDLPEGGRWFELVRGELVQHEPPDEAHGTTLLNLSKAIAEHLQRVLADPPVPPLTKGGQGGVGYACFELGLVVARKPDTVRTPPISYFEGERRFEFTDSLLTDAVPRLVVEIVSTKGRRIGIASRVEAWLAHGVEAVWVADPHDRRVHVYRRNASPQRLAEHETLLGRPVLPGFSIKVADVFAEPSWWRGSMER